MFLTSEFWSPGLGSPRREPVITENETAGLTEICFPDRCGVSEERSVSGPEASLMSTSRLGEPGEEETGGERGETKPWRPVTDAISGSSLSPLPVSSFERSATMATENLNIGSPVHGEETPAAGQMLMLSTGATRSVSRRLHLFILLLLASSFHVLHAQGKSRIGGLHRCNSGPPKSPDSATTYTAPDLMCSA
ncbi:hypothetical protein NHX12_018809 [Muraenolepis orangiensis]|uniref:Uncharacterized protein n=1 Tax=Muraenolepis orangiensis TaxID=630683 RepID=A0A9Q0F021_9TELE|nr:hypothetical protein NHX12_018809 [Muraenolepis orangiensis]